MRIMRPLVVRIGTRLGRESFLATEKGFFVARYNLVSKRILQNGEGRSRIVALPRCRTGSPDDEH